MKGNIVVAESRTTVHGFLEKNLVPEIKRSVKDTESYCIKWRHS